MPAKSTVYFVTDIETTKKRRICFDVAWKAIDNQNREYGRGSYVIRDAFFHDVPWFAEKLGHYFDDTFAGLIKPATIREVRKEYNRQVKTLQDKGHRVILCAYNAAFDFKYLPETLSILTGGKESRWLDSKAELMDIWHVWGNSVPKGYKESAAITESGKFYSTSAESAYRYETRNAKFEERHIAWSDVEIEADILLKALSRKKKMPVVKSPAEFVGSLYRHINNRLGVNGKDILPGFVKKELMGV